MVAAGVMPVAVMIGKNLTNDKVINMHKIFDLAVKTGEYQDRQTGQTKGRWQNVGAVIQGDDGGQFILLERWFNPAGIADPQGRGTTMISCFAPQQQGGQQQALAQQGYQQGGYQQQNTQQQRQPQQQAAPAQDYDQDIPF